MKTSRTRANRQEGRPPLLLLGPEADDPSLTITVLRTALQKRRGGIKPALLDQKLVAGIGNIYASESLWRARIHPAAAASAIGPERAGRLLDGIRAALADGVASAGRYGSGARAIPLDVYDREGEACPRCGGVIRRVVQAGRSTYFCPRCQRR